ncbi:hypothetical protein N2152v2_002927 [Parachlorella kessleri]
MPALLIDDQVVRFCQQCGRFHPLTEFSDERRSCRNSLALHNARRRKSRLRISARAGQRTSAAAAAAAAEDAPPLAACEAALSSPLEMPPVTRKVEPRAPDATWPAVSAAAAAAGSAEAAAAAGGGSDGPRGEELLAPLPSVVDGQAELLPDMATWDMLSEPLDASFLQDAFGCMDSDTSPCGLGVGDAAFQLDTPVELPVQHMADPVPCDWEQPDGAEKIEDRQQQQQQQQHGQQVYSLQHQHGLQLQEEVLELKRQQQQFQQQQEQDLRNQLQLGQPPAQPPRPSPFEDMCAGSVDVGAGEWQLFCSTPLQSGHEHPSPARGIVSQGALAASVTEPARGHACLPEAAQALDDGDWDMACADPGWVPVAPVPLEAGAPSPTQQPALNSWIAVAGQSMPRAAPEGPAPAGAFAALPVLKFKICLKCANMPALVINDQVVRFCQQCGRFHPLTDFDAERRSCRDSLAVHNARRRKSRLHITSGAARQRAAAGAAAAAAATSAAAAAAAAAAAPAACEAAATARLDRPPVTSQADHGTAGAARPASTAAIAAAAAAFSAAGAVGAEAAAIATGSEGQGGQELLAPHASLMDGQVELLPDTATWDMLCEPLEEGFFQDTFASKGSSTNPYGLTVGDAAVQHTGPDELPAVQHIADLVQCEWEQSLCEEESDHHDQQQQQQQQQALQSLQKQQHGQQVQPHNHQHILPLQQQVLELQLQQQRFQQEQERELRKLLQPGQAPSQQQQHSHLRPSPFSDMCTGSTAADEWQLFCSTPLQPGLEHPSPARGSEGQGAPAPLANEMGMGLDCLPAAAQALGDGEWDMACAAPGWVPVAPAPIEAGAPSPTQRPALDSWPPPAAGLPLLRASPAEGPAAGASAALPVLLRSTSLCSSMDVDLSPAPALPGSELPMQQLRSPPLPAPWSPPRADLERLSQSLFQKPFSELAPHLQQAVLPCMAADKEPPGLRRPRRTRGIIEVHRTQGRLQPLLPSGAALKAAEVAAMVRTRSRASSEDEFPLFHALIAGNATTIAALCTTKEATKCGPGSLSAVMLTLLLDRDTYLPQLIAAGAPLDVPLTLSSANAEMQQWLAAAQLTDSAVVRQEVRAVLQGNFKRGLCPLGLALSLSKWEQAKLLVAAGADLQPLFQDHDCYDWEQVKEYALSYFSGQGWGAAPAARLGQLALLAVQESEPDTCLAALQAAADRGVRLSTSTAEDVMQHAADCGYVEIVMHMVQHSPGSVWSLLRRNTHFRPALAKALFPDLAQQFVEGWMLVEKVKQQQQQQQPPLLSEADLTTLLCAAAASGHPALVMHLLRRGADVWQVLGAPAPPTSGYQPSSCKIHRSVAAVLFPRLVQQYADGSVQVRNTSEELAVLVCRASQCGCSNAALALLELATARQLLLSADQAFALLRAAAEEGQPEVLEAGAPQLDSTRLGSLVVRAAACWETQASLALLRAAAKEQEGWNMQEGDTRVLRTLEALLAAGYKPTVYRDVRLEPGAQPVAIFDPIIEHPLAFSYLGNNRWLWLALGPEVWTTATHQQHPRSLKLTSQAVLLLAARSRKGQVVQEQGEGGSYDKRQRLAVAGSPISKACSCSGSAARLGALPDELLLRVLQLAARPLSAWLTMDGEDGGEDDFGSE